MSNQPITQVTDNGETPALTSPSTRAASAAARFRQLLATPDVIQCPVIYDVMSAKLSAQLGFPALYAGGQTVSASMYGVGDYGTITISELIEFSARIVDAVDVPVVGDADDGGGGPLNVYRTIRRYERVGVACVMIEDMYGVGAKRVTGDTQAGGNPGALPGKSNSPFSPYAGRVPLRPERAAIKE